MAIGNEAPPFVLNDQDKRAVELSDLRGRWVILYFYPRDDTPGCTIEANDFSRSLEEFETLGAVVCGCSPDDAASHRRFIEKCSLRYRLLSDPDHSTMALYGAWGEKEKRGETITGIIRSTTLVDPDGLIAYHWPQVKAEGHAQQVMAKLRELVEARAAQP